MLVNSNPATIMTDPELADRTYVEPLTVDVVAKIIERERPDAVLPTVGGQTALNLAIELEEHGVLAKYGVKLIGASVEAIKVAEDRQLFREAMTEIGIDTPASAVVKTLDEAMAAVARTGFPAIIRPSFTMGGVGGGIAYNVEEFREIAGRGLSLSPIHEVLIEQSVIGWKEFELEVMRDVDDNFVVICSIENIDPMGVHTGDSITIAPALTLTDKEYQRMRDAARRIIRRVGVETGGSNIQFAINPEDGRLVVIEMNPRVSRSSALASKATGFPIAKIAAKLALGYRLDEIPNDITRVTPASFEPTIDYIVVKIPRWAFEKFPQADETLTTQMKSVGEAMAIGRTFKQAFLKGIRSLELGSRTSLFGQPKDETDEQLTALQRQLVIPNDRRMWALFRALERGWTTAQIHELTKIDPWFLAQFADIQAMANEVKAQGKDGADAEAPALPEAPGLRRQRSRAPRRLRRERDPVARAAPPRSRRPSSASTPAPPSSSRSRRISTAATTRSAKRRRRTNKKVVILGSGPNRIGQGIEFDYCCCHAAFALRDAGYETVMVNCNPETVSTDYDSVDRLFFEPLTFEDVMSILDTERSAGAEVSVVVQFGGQTPLKLALPLQEAGVRIIGTSPDSIDLAEDRERFSALLNELQIPQPQNGMAVSKDEALEVARGIGYPVVVRPSYVLGGRAMAIVYDAASLERYMANAVDASPERPILIDRFLEDAFELDVDALADAEGHVVIGGVMEHIEEAGIHSGDSSCVVPTYLVADKHLQTIRDYTRRIARALKVIGLMNAQFAIKDDQVYVLEVNPRASRTVPYLSKASGVPLAKIAARLMAGETLPALGLTAGHRGHRRVRQGAGVPVRALPGRRHDPRAGDEVDRRGDGRRVVVRHRVRQGAARGRAAAAAVGRGVHQRQQRRQAERPRHRPRPRRRSASSWWRRAAPPPTCARTASTSTSPTRSTKAARTSAIASTTRRSRSSSTRRWDASRSSTTAPCGARR